MRDLEGFKFSEFWDSLIWKSAWHMASLVAWTSLVNSEAKAVIRASELEEYGMGWALWEWSRWSVSHERRSVVEALSLVSWPSLPGSAAEEQDRDMVWSLHEKRVSEFIQSSNIMETIGQGVQVGLAAEGLEGLVNHRRFEGLGDKMKVKRRFRGPRAWVGQEGRRWGLEEVTSESRVSEMQIWGAVGLVGSSQSLHLSHHFGQFISNIWLGWAEWIKRQRCEVLEAPSTVGTKS